MVKDHLGQDVTPGNYVFYHGGLYKVERTTEGQGPVNNFVHMQYAAGYQLKRLKRVCSYEVCLVANAPAELFILKENDRRAVYYSICPPNND